jgi:hypothetical protein
MHLAQLNVRRLRAPMDALADFTYRSGHVEFLRPDGSGAGHGDGARTSVPVKPSVRTTVW